MAEVSGYAQLLRAIGQALETLSVRSFELAPEGEDFVVHGTVPLIAVNPLPNPVNKHTLRVVWGSATDAENVDATQSRTAQPETLTAVDLHYTVQDIERLEYEGQARRQNPHRLADATSLSQVLRCMGAYLNQKCARLLKLAREDDVLTLEYETSLGSFMKESFSASGLYDLWVRMYLQRADRVAQ
jgi:hypothetical protein